MYPSPLQALCISSFVLALAGAAAERNPDLPDDFEASHAAMAEAFTHGALELDDGTRLAYHIREAGGPNLVLIPGSWGDYLTFNRLVPHLDPNLRVIVIELRGHGGSGPALIGGTMESFADDVLRVIAHLDLDRYYVGGHSIGGMLAVEIAGRAPEGLAGAIPMEGWTHHSVQENAFGHIQDYEMDPAHAAERAANRARGLARLTDAEREDFATIWRKWDGNEALKTTPVPVLELWGDRGQATRPGRDVLQIPERGNIEVIWIPNASHGHLVEKPAAGAAAINAFVARLEESRPADR